MMKIKEILKKKLIKPEKREERAENEQRKSIKWKNKGRENQQNQQRT